MNKIELRVIGPESRSVDTNCQTDTGRSTKGAMTSKEMRILFLLGATFGMWLSVSVFCFFSYIVFQTTVAAVMIEAITTAAGAYISLSMAAKVIRVNLWPNEKQTVKSRL